MSKKITEATIQAVLMAWAMNEKHHDLVVENSTTVYPWESDLISVTHSSFAHEYEIKLSVHDYHRDAEKKWKHIVLSSKQNEHVPNYFWYVTYDFDIVPPSHAGWIKITLNAKWQLDVSVKIEAPRLHNYKMPQSKQLCIGRLLSFRIARYFQKYLNIGDERDER